MREGHHRPQQHLQPGVTDSLKNRPESTSFEKTKNRIEAQVEIVMKWQWENSCEAAQFLTPPGGNSSQ